MGRAPCCDKLGLKKGPWTPEEDQKLVAYIKEHGHGNWRSLPKQAGLLRCGKSCRLRWTNYLRPDIKRGDFSPEEEENIIHLHAMLGNRWSMIASQLPGRTDNEIKNVWNTHLKKRLLRMGIDPVTHSPATTSNATNATNVKCRNARREARLPRDILSLPLQGSTNVETANGYAEQYFQRQLEYETCCSLVSCSHESPILNARKDTDELLGQATGLPACFQEMEQSTTDITEQHGNDRNSTCNFFFNPNVSSELCAEQKPELFTSVFAANNIVNGNMISRSNKGCIVGTDQKLMLESLKQILETPDDDSHPKPSNCNADIDVKWELGFSGNEKISMENQTFREKEEYNMGWHNCSENSLEYYGSSTQVCSQISLSPICENAIASMDQLPYSSNYEIVRDMNRSSSSNSSQICPVLSFSEEAVVDLCNNKMHVTNVPRPWPEFRAEQDVNFWVNVLKKVSPL